MNPSPNAHPPHDDDAALPLADRLAALVHRLQHVLPAQAPIRDFVHHNTLHGFQHLPFHEALREARRTLGIRAYQHADFFRARFAEGRIDERDLAAVLDTLADGKRVIVQNGDQALTWRSLVEIALRHDLQIDDSHGESPRSSHGDSLWSQKIEEVAALLPEDDAAAHDPFCAQWDESLAWQSLADGVGRYTLNRLLYLLTGEDALDRCRPLLLRLLGNGLDLGMAQWHAPTRSQGLYASFRALPADDPARVAELLPDAQREILALDADPLAAIGLELACTGVPEDRWMDYLQALALELPGWSGMVLWRHLHPDYRDGGGVPVSLYDYLAIRLVLERLATQDIVRRHWQTPAAVPALDTIRARLLAHPGELRVRLAAGHRDTPEWLSGVLERERELARLAEKRVDPQLGAQVAAVAPAVRAIRREAAARPLVNALRHAGLAEAALDRAQVAQLSAALDQIDDDTIGRHWLEAYERHYREGIFATLSANHGRFAGHPTRPSAQVVFCMDEREEGMRRHLEEIAPAVETLGVAAHFGVFQCWRGLDDDHDTPLAPVVPVVVKPAHRVRELARDDAALATHRQQQARRLGWLGRLHGETRAGGLAAAALGALGAPGALIDLFGRSLAPAAMGRLPATPATRIAFTAPDDAPPASAEQLREGFTAAEQAERIGNFLRGMGLTARFAPLVVIAGHGSNSRNNPHGSAYDCGACAGRHSGPNARLFAAMANHPPTRAKLAESGILIPDDTWFLGAEHNTCDDGITWYDLDDLPKARGDDFARLDAALAEASREHARERCRRLASAPLHLSPQQALRHVQGRREDIGQPRPELGHVTNACAFIGRRNLSRGAFFDRRSFLISYDPTQDADGKILERLLLANGPVGAGISLEYYFSTVNNEQFGCGTKIVHNVAGQFGVMEGASSDLRTGLPKQMIEIHEAMRLLVVVEQKIDLVTAIYQRQPPLQELIGNGWIVVAAKDPDAPDLHRFDPAQGWLRWQGDAPPDTVACSLDWFAHKREPLPPVLLTQPLRVGDKGVIA